MNQSDDLLVVYTLFDAQPPNPYIHEPLASTVSITRYQDDGRVTDQYVNNRLTQRIRYNGDDQPHGWSEYFHPIPPT